MTNPRRRSAWVHYWRLFAEHRTRAAVVEDGRYYARDRADLGSGVPDRIAGGRLLPLPARSAALGAEGIAGDYEGGAPEDLERALADHLVGAPALATDAGESLSPERQEELRALGYLE